MKRTLFLLFATLFATVALAQVNQLPAAAQQNHDSVNEQSVFESVDEMPMFMGGDINTFGDWFAGEFKIPAAAVENGIQGRVLVKFVVEKDGSLGDIEFLQSPDKVYEEEVSRVLKSSPKWTPGRKDGKVVRVFYIMPVNCRLE